MASPDTIAFVFLLEDPGSIRAISKPKQLLVLGAGSAMEIKRFAVSIRKLKGGLSKSARQELTGANLHKRLAATEKLKSMRRLLGMLSVGTAAINIFSLYLRKLPPPSVGSDAALAAYSALVLAVHFGALLLLLALIIICLAYTVKYGVMLLRRL